MKQLDLADLTVAILLGFIVVLLILVASVGYCVGVSQGGAP